MKRLTKEEVNKRLEKYDVVLVSEYTHQYDQTAVLRCKCGATFNACVKHAMTGRKCQCENCDLQRVKRQLATFGIALQQDPPLHAIFTTKVPMLCFCGTVFHSVIPLALNREMKGCGCAAKSAWDKKEVAGLKINKLTVLSNTSVKNSKNQYSYQCLCDCGKEVVVLCQKILKGDAFSCSQCSKVHAANMWSLQREKLPKKPRFQNPKIPLTCPKSPQRLLRQASLCHHKMTDEERFERRNRNAQKIGRSAFTNEQVQERLDQYGLTLLSDYTRNIHPIKVRCKCGEEYWAKFIHITRGKKTTCLKCEFVTIKQKLAAYGTQILTNQEEYMGENAHASLQCFCGNTFSGRPGKHLNGYYKGSCGCATHIKGVNLAGTKLNHFTILSNNFVRKNGINYLPCQCDCGQVVLIAHHYLTAKKSQMCNTCSALNSTKGIRERNAKEVSDYLSRYEYTQISPYRGTLRKIEVRCCCGKIVKMKCGHLLKLARQNVRLNCKCNKIKNGRMTSNPVFKLHDILGRGVHNYNGSAGCIDIALCYKGKKVAIEYDEWWWHKDHKAKDDRKNKKLLDNGWFVLRLRVSGYLPTYREMIRSLDKLIRSETRFLARTHKSWRGYTKED